MVNIDLRSGLRKGLEAGMGDPGGSPMRWSPRGDEAFQDLGAAGYLAGAGLNNRDLPAARSTSTKSKRRLILWGDEHSSSRLGGDPPHNFTKAGRDHRSGGTSSRSSPEPSPGSHVPDDAPSPPRHPRKWREN